jgi:putative membrane protein
MKRSLTDYLMISLKGMAMGAADVVPGVSGGTIAFISGIYEELIESLNNINSAAFKELKSKGFKHTWDKLNGAFLLALMSGILTSIFSLAKGVEWFLEHHPILLWAFFFGLVAASIVYISKQIKATLWDLAGLKVFLAITIGGSMAYFITTLNPVEASDSNLFLFFAGALAICAMILPGISGAFILVIIGAYGPVLEAISNRDIKTILVIGAGTIVGLLSFSKLLKWLFKTYHQLTLAVLTGFMIGSLNKIWPWKVALTYRMNSKGMEVPLNEKSISPFNYEGDPQFLQAIGLMLFGFLIILFLEKIGNKTNIVDR